MDDDVPSTRRADAQTRGAECLNFVPGEVESAGIPFRSGGSRVSMGTLSFNRHRIRPIAGNFRRVKSELAPTGLVLNRSQCKSSVLATQGFLSREPPEAGRRHHRTPGAAPLAPPQGKLLEAEFCCIILLGFSVLDPQPGEVVEATILPPLTTGCRDKSYRPENLENFFKNVISFLTGILPEYIQESISNNNRCGPGSENSSGCPKGEKKIAPLVWITRELII